ncbi:kinase-like domain-containing protein [Gautieria morchelliformis]|nr:kinase-like domain-containing protein [Gautieria morchelliformis]
MSTESELKFPVVTGFQIKEQIGGGGFSTVYRATNSKLDVVAACKVVPLTPETTKQERKTLNKEIQVHGSLKHINILEFINAVIVEPDGKSPWFPAAYMLLEIAAGGDLFDKIAPYVGVDEDLAHLYFSQLVAGMNFVHGQGVVHRDLKPENLLLDVAGQVKISDFGLCSVFRYKGQTRQLTAQCGSLPYVAPELVHAPDRPYDAEPVDIWGMGVILFTLLCGITPWDQPTEDDPEYARFLSGEILSEAPWNRISENALSLLLGILTVDVQERMTLPEILQHPWYSKSNGLLDQTGIELAEHLTRALRVSGDLQLAEPNLNTTERDVDGDELMLSAHAASQFTQTLQLFSQTQSGKRYCPHLTRFYTTISPPDLMDHILVALQTLGVKFQVRDAEADERGKEFRKTKIGGYDKRKERFTGYVEIENFSWSGGEYHGSFCVMRREKGNPISWRQLWKALISSAEVDPYVIKKRQP